MALDTEHLFCKLHVFPKLKCTLLFDISDCRVSWEFHMARVVFHFVCNPSVSIRHLGFLLLWANLRWTESCTNIVHMFPSPSRKDSWGQGILTKVFDDFPKLALAKRLYSMFQLQPVAFACASFSLSVGFPLIFISQTEDWGVSLLSETVFSGDEEVESFFLDPLTLCTSAFFHILSSFSH